MPTTTPPSIPQDTIDNLLYSARTGDLETLHDDLTTLTKAHNTPPSTLIPHIIDPASKNTLLHMASANGHCKILSSIFETHLSTGAARQPLVNSQNASGNTALHWAALNGHLDAAKVLVGAGADIKIKNAAGHEAMYEAERNGKEELAEWLLSLGDEKGVKEEDGGRDGAETDGIHDDAADEKDGIAEAVGPE